MKEAYQWLKNVYHYFQAQAWRARYGWPDRKLTIHGVTGTNGKTTTSIVLGSILRAAHGRDKVGLITTEVFWFGEQEQTNATHMTSVDARIVFQYFRRMVDQGVTHVVLEMTSHALHQHRLAGVRLVGAILLNIQHEHLDYHKTMSAYAAAKARIARYLAPTAPLIAKRDDEWVERGVSALPSSVMSQSQVVWFASKDAHDIATPLPGDFNQENVLAASLLAEKLGVAESAIEEGVATVTHIPGRVEWLAAPSGARVVIDFALTPYSYERLFAYLRRETDGKLFAVFGAAGRRDKEKRPVISKIVAKYADEIVITQDEPYDDPEEEIYSQLEAGLTDATIPWQRIEDRREAMKYAIDKAASGDIVAITGMGNFDVRMVGTKAIPWKDKEVVQELFAERA